MFIYNIQREHEFLMCIKIKMAALFRVYIEHPSYICNIIKISPTHINMKSDKSSPKDQSCEI